MDTREIIAALESNEATLPFGGPFVLVTIKDHVYRLASGSGSYLLKWIADSDSNGINELNVNQTLLQRDDIAAPPLAAVIHVDGGTMACWDWLAGPNLMVENRHLLPEAFAELGRFHVRRRHAGPVVSPMSRDVFPSVRDLVAAGIDRLLPLVEPSLRPGCAACLSRLEQGYATLIHGDVHPGNVILTEQGLHFVDWSLTVPSLNYFDLEYVESVTLDPQVPVGAYMPPPESAAILDAYAAHCGISGVDIASVHLAVMLWRDLYSYESFLERAQRDEKREAAYRQRVLQLAELARAGG